MNLFSILLIAFAMSTDAFAVAISKGVAMARPTLPQAIRIGLIFGAIEALTPVIGWLLGSVASRAISEWGHWVAFGLLMILGLRMMYAGCRRDSDDSSRLAPQTLPMLSLAAFATSIDAMAVGVSFAFVDVNILVAALAIGGATLLMVTLGVMLGRVLGQLAGQRAEVMGGVILIAIGNAILFQHLAGTS
jgi:putative Mn2+ efflux pump MntP